MAIGTLWSARRGREGQESIQNAVSIVLASHEFLNHERLLKIMKLTKRNLREKSKREVNVW